jgi:hypothetical protein
MSLTISEKSSSLQQAEAEQSELPQSQSSVDFPPSAVDAGLSKIRNLFGSGATTSSSATVLMQSSVLSKPEQTTASACRPFLLATMMHASVSLQRGDGCSVDFTGLEQGRLLKCTEN